MSASWRQHILGGFGSLFLCRLNICAVSLTIDSKIGNRASIRSTGASSLNSQVMAPSTVHQSFPRSSRKPKMWAHCSILPALNSGARTERPFLSAAEPRCSETTVAQGHTRSRKGPLTLVHRLARRRQNILFPCRYR